MDGTVIKLSAPVESFGKTYAKLTLREPKGGLYARLGDPRIAVINPQTGSGYWVEQPETIKAYLESIVVEATADNFPLEVLSLVDFMKLKKALFDFFSAAAEKAAAA